ncbi:hypothetical protein V1264_004922 [Littorina saxatilis]|uniref:Uncharacterized protein n=1 Tax=Littorina saxatilis TaxID=31220 RepID=A0AAN9B327_9CAEN
MFDMDVNLRNSDTNVQHSHLINQNTLNIPPARYLPDLHNATVHVVVGNEFFPHNQVSECDCIMPNGWRCPHGHNGTNGTHGSNHSSRRNDDGLKRFYTYLVYMVYSKLT